MAVAHPLRPVFILGDDPAATALRDALAARPGWCGLPKLDLLTRMSRLLWGHEYGGGEAGVSSLVDRPHLAASLRRLADALVSAVIPHGSAYTVDVVTDAELLGRYLREVWPDALVVALGAPQSEPGLAAADPDLWVPAGDVTSDLAAAVARVEVAASESVVDLPGPADAGTVTFRPERSPLHERVVVVLGAARSGTTWVHRLLSANPWVAGTATGETWLFPDVAPLGDAAVCEAVGEGLAMTAVRVLCDDLLSGLLRGSGVTATHVCEKTPTTVWQLPFVARLYPDAHYVHVVRDGRDAAMSLALTRGEDADLAAAATEWVEAVSAIRAAAPQLARVHEVRYEDLLVDPHAVVSELWDWIGVPPSEEARQTLERRSGERITPLAPSGEIGAGKWRSLPDADRELLESVTGDLLRELGYPASSA